MIDPPELDFDAGQWISVPFDAKVVRAWTILSTPARKRSITLSVDAAPGGIGSQWLRALKVGDPVPFKGPAGGFVFSRADPRRAVFVAEEIGIVAVRSILAHLYETGYGRPTILISWGRDPSWLLYDAEFRSLARRYPGWGGLVASLPLTSLLAMIWLFRDTHDPNRVAELSVSGLTAGSLPVVDAAPLPHVLPVGRDLTVDVTDTVAAADVARAIEEAGGELLATATLAGTYRGHPLGPDERSLTYRLTFGAGDRTLTDAELDAALEAIAGALRHHLGARIRG